MIEQYTYTIKIVTKNNEPVAEGIVTAWENDPDDPELVRIDLQFNGREFSVSNDNYFNGLQEIRLQLEPENLFLHCYGASKNVYPSGMSFSMGQGWLGYKMTMGKPALTADQVGIFETGDDVILSTVAEQEAFHDIWIGGFMKK